MVRLARKSLIGRMAGRIVIQRWREALLRPTNLQAPLS
jgi:hypothetical protein